MLPPHHSGDPHLSNANRPTRFQRMRYAQSLYKERPSRPLWWRIVWLKQIDRPLMQKSGEGFWGAGAWCIMVGDKQAECHNRVPFYGLRMIIFSRLGALVSPNISYLCSVRGTFFLLKTDKYSEFTSVILWNSVRCKSCSLRVCSTKTRIKTERL